MDVEQYLSNFFKGTKEHKLDAMKYFMEEFNHPEKNLKFIHIAGTNGKGSCIEMMNNILINCGYKVGKFISPHLSKYNERISINNINISDDEIEKMILKIKPKIDKYEKENNHKITFFELETTMAILYFSENKCDFVVLETGLGGKYDCTNIVNPVVSIITSIGYDHMQILGNTLEEIAEQKAGIIKEKSDTIFVEQNDLKVNEIIKNKCKEKSNTLHLVKKEDILNYSYNSEFQKFDYKNYKNILVNLKGKKQVYNASICIECAQILKDKSYKIDEEKVKDALKTVIHKGRFEIINNNPLIIYDGAHNEPAIENFVNTVNMYYKEKKKVYIVSILKGKDYKAMLKILLEDKNSMFIFTDGNSKEKYEEKEELLKIAKEYTSNKNLYIMDLEEAINLAKSYKDRVIFIVGSFYIYGEVTDKIKKLELKKGD